MTKTASGRKGLLQNLSLGERLSYLRFRSQGKGRQTAIKALYAAHPEADKYGLDQFKAYERSQQANDEAKGHLTNSFADKGRRLLSLCEMAGRYLNLFYETSDDDVPSLVRLGEQARYCFTDIGKLADGLPQEQIQAPMEALAQAMAMAMQRDGAKEFLPTDFSFPGREKVDHSRPSEN